MILVKEILKILAKKNASVRPWTSGLLPIQAMAVNEDRIPFLGDVYQDFKPGEC